MVKYTLLVGFGVMILLAVILIINVTHKKIKYWLLISPFVLGGGLYGGLYFLSKNMLPGSCDGAVIIGILFSFILIGIGICLNIIHLLSLLLSNYISVKNNK